jgi:hypothetical protein
MASISAATLAAFITIAVPVATPLVVAAAVVVVPVCAITITPTGAIPAMVVLTCLVIVDRAIATTLETIIADVVVACVAGSLIIVDRTVATALEAVCANIIIGHRTVGVRLIIIDRTIAAELHAIRIEIVRERNRGRSRRRLRPCAERGARPGDCPKSYT